MAGNYSTISTLALGSLLAAAALQPLGCGEPEPVDTTGDEEVAAVLRQVDVVVTDALGAFISSAEDLESAARDWSDVGPSGRDAARAAFIETMSRWQAVEVMQIGPIGASTTTIGGKDLADEVYSWPESANGCTVDFETVDETWSDPDFYVVNLVTSYGLDALEHLFYAGEEHLCPSQIGIDSQWSELGSEGVDAKRAEFAIALSQGLVAMGQTLEAEWADFAPELLGDSEIIASRAEGLNEVFDALFYLETGLRDRKLAEPLGIRECASDCEELVESKVSGVGGLWIAENLRAGRILFTGGDGEGLDDLLLAKGEEALSTSILEAFDGAIVAADTAEPDLYETLASDPAALQALHDDIKVVTDLLKNDLPTVLALTIPQEAGGDND